MSKFDNVKIEILKDETLSKNWYHLRNITYDYTNSKGETKVIRREAYDRGNGATILLTIRVARRWCWCGSFACQPM